MMFTHSNLRTALAVAAIVAAALVAGCYWFASRPTVNEATLRDTAGVEVTVVEMRRTDCGITTGCLVENRSSREASSVVFTVQITDADGGVLAANPLANALAVKPGEQRSVSVLVPVTGDVPPASPARAQVNLVRWGD